MLVFKWFPANYAPQRKKSEKKVHSPAKSSYIINVGGDDAATANNKQTHKK